MDPGGISTTGSKRMRRFILKRNLFLVLVSQITTGILVPSGEMLSGKVCAYLDWIYFLPQMKGVRLVVIYCLALSL